MNGRISELASYILQGVANAKEDTCEASSTEDLLSEVELFNKLVREGKIVDGKLMVGSLDEESIYPSIDTREAARVCRDRVVASPLQIEGVCYRTAVLYLQQRCPPLKRSTTIFKEYCLEERTSRGARPHSTASAK